VGLRRSFALTLVPLILGLLVARLASADARSEARGHFRRGMEAIAAGRYDEGIVELERAYELLPHPNVLYNLGRAHAEAGHLEQAIAYYTRYVQTDPSDRAETEALIQDLDAQRKRLERAREEAASKVPQAPPPAAPPPAAPPPSPSKPPEDVFAESVVTASKGAQSPLDAPSAVSIITEQDIRLSGITRIPELLRRLAGVDIMQVTGGQAEVSLRGFNQRLSNKVLVLVDGRSVYADILGATLWQTLSIGVEDIERIEVVRGPGSSMYGADAFNGVINILTRKPGDGKSGLSGAFGSGPTTHGSLWATGKDGEFSWRMSAGYDALPRWSREVPDGRVDVRLGDADQRSSARTVRFDARGSRRIGKIGTLQFGGGLSEGSLEILGIGALQDIVLPSVVATDVTTSFASEHLDARVFYNRLRGESALNAVYVGQSLLPSRLEQNIVDGELSYKGRLVLASDLKNDLRVGLAYRFKDVQWTYLDRHRVEHHYALYVHDELRIAEPLSLIADYRIDWVPFLERFQQSPRGALVFRTSTRSALRGSVATAFRKPTFLESYLSLPVQLSAPGAAQLAESSRRDNPGFRVDAERILSAEIGYLNHESDLAQIDAALFYSRVSNLIELASPRPITMADVQAAGGQDPSTGLFPVAFGGWDNQCQAYHVYGGEAGMRSNPFEGFDVYANYSLLLSQQDNTRCSPERLSRITEDQRTSRHKLNVGVQLRTKAGVDSSVDVHTLSEQNWAEQATDALRQSVSGERLRLAPYTLFNARLGYRFLGEHADVAVVGFNLLGGPHRQHPLGQLVDRRVMVQLTYRFQ
jgi:outer membrane receptor for ferrienterochelin and colicin